MGYNIREAAFYGFPILEAGNFTPSISHYEEQRSLNSGGERSTHFGLTPLLEAKPTVLHFNRSVDKKHRCPAFFSLFPLQNSNQRQCLT